MPQIFVNPENIRSGRFVVSGPEAHHLIRVLRKKTNDTIDFFDGLGNQYQGRLEAVYPKDSRAEGVVLTHVPTVSTFLRVNLLQGLPRGSKFDFVIEKTTELGVDAIFPFLSRKNLIRLDCRQSGGKVDRWGKLAESASKQCYRPNVPSVSAPVPLEELGGLCASHPTLVLSACDKAIPLQIAIARVPKGGGVLNIVIGPESGFSEKELSWLESKGGVLVTLGARVLRSETAGLAVLSIVNYHFDRFAS